MPQASLSVLLHEDFVTHGSTLTSPGFWALVAHRVATSVQASVSRPLRHPLSVLAGTLASAVDRVWKIRIPRSTLVGRRVALRGCGPMFLHARSIGDDVCIHSGTTFGPLCTSPDSEDLPVIESGVQLGVHTRVLGEVTIGKGARIPDECIVLDSVAAGAQVQAAQRQAISKL